MDVYKDSEENSANINVKAVITVKIVIINVADTVPCPDDVTALQDNVLADANLAGTLKLVSKKQLQVPSLLFLPGFLFKLLYSLLLSVYSSLESFQNIIDVLNTVGHTFFYMFKLYRCIHFLSFFSLFFHSSHER